jgi:hypothetical protein
MSRSTFKNESLVNSAYVHNDAPNPFNGTPRRGPVTIVLQNRLTLAITVAQLCGPTPHQKSGRGGARFARRVQANLFVI